MGSSQECVGSLVRSSTDLFCKECVETLCAASPMGLLARQNVLMACGWNMLGKCPAFRVLSLSLGNVARKLCDF